MAKVLYFTPTPFIISYHELDAFMAAEFGLIKGNVIFPHEQQWKR